MIPIPKGFSFGAAAAGFKKPGRLDLGLAVSETEAAAAGVFTKNAFAAAPVVACREALEREPRARAVLVNSGQANACTGDKGLVDCRVTLEMVGKAVGVDQEMILPASTGVIGPRLKLERWRAAMDELAGSLGKAGPLDFAKAMMTTDTFPKPAWGVMEHDGQVARVLGLAKGAGMICPDMATMLGFVFTDAKAEPALVQEALAEAVETSFNRITVDGDTSTNDSVIVLANGAAGLTLWGEEGRRLLAESLSEVCRALAYMIVEDAEGGTKVIRVRVAGANSDAEAELAARTVGNSPLVKTAMYGRDANWGRIVAALGRCGADFDPELVSISIGGVRIFHLGRPMEGDADALLAAHMRRGDVAVDVRLGKGKGEYELLASDLTHEYVSINADYRS